MATSILIQGAASKFGSPEASMRCPRSYASNTGSGTRSKFVTRLKPSYQYWEPVRMHLTPDNKKALVRNPIDNAHTCSHSGVELAQSVLAFYNFVYATTPVPNKSSASLYGVGALLSWKPPALYLTPVVLQLLLVCKHTSMLTEVGEPFDDGDNVINTTHTTNNDCVRFEDSRKEEHDFKNDLINMPIEAVQHDPATCKEVKDSELDCFHESDYDCDEYTKGAMFYCQSEDEDDYSDDGDSFTSDIETDCLSEEGSIVFCPHAETITCSQDDTTFNPALKVILSHTSSFSSEESGFYESNQSDWSEDEEIEEIGACELNNELWTMFQDMGCFRYNDVPKGEMSAFNDATPSHMTEDDADVLEDTLLGDDAMLHHNQLTNHASANSVTGHNNDLTPTQTDHHPSLEQELSNECHSKSIPNKAVKCVRFKPEAELVQVHMIVAWDFAYRDSRKGPWEELARDRDRFRRRIDSLSEVLEPCLQRKVDYYNH